LDTLFFFSLYDLICITGGTCGSICGENGIRIVVEPHCYIVRFRTKQSLQCQKREHATYFVIIKRKKKVIITLQIKEKKAQKKGGKWSI
jgi:hypothetical protein